MSLWSEFLTNEQRNIHKWTHYFPAYERHLSRFRDRSITMLEIGCGEGGSLQMWKQYLGPHAQIVGIDVEAACKGLEEPQIAVRIGDQSDPEFLAVVLEEFGPLDLVLDDGSHRGEHILASFQALYPQMDRNGVYLVEDLHTAYWEDFGGGHKREGSFIEVIKGFIDELHAEYSQGAVESTEFSRTTMSLHVYDSLVAIERGRHIEKRPARTGRDAVSRSEVAEDWPHSS